MEGRTHVFIRFNESIDYCIHFVSFHFYAFIAIFTVEVRDEDESFEGSFRRQRVLST